MYSEPPANHWHGGSAKSMSMMPVKTKKVVNAVWAESNRTVVLNHSSFMDSGETVVYPWSLVNMSGVTVRSTN